MQKTAIITGASGGIGLELAKIHAAKGDNLILVARTASKLTELKNKLEEEYQISVDIIAKDLSVENAAQVVYDIVHKKNIQIHYLINNAGFGSYGLFSETDWHKEANMLQLNITALTQLCKLFLKDMLAHGEGKILNVASTAAFQPGPLMSVYFATKAYVLHFSEAIANEVKDKGISVTTLCPPATESGFHSVAQWEACRLIKDKKLPTAKQVAEYGYKAMTKGKTLAIYGRKNRIMAKAAAFAPRSLSAKAVRFLLEEKR